MPTKTVQAQAAIAEVETTEDGLLTSWSAEDSFGNSSRTFRGTAANLAASLQVGQPLSFYAGYDQSRVLVGFGNIDSADVSETIDGVQVQVVGRDEGARNATTVRFSRTWFSLPPRARPKAHQVIRDAANIVGIDVGTLEFPDYSLTVEFVVQKRTILELVSQLTEPWNLFAAIQYVTRVQGNSLSVVKVDWTDPGSGGTVLSRNQYTTQNRRQLLYLEEPRLTQFNRFVVRGATYAIGRVSLGVVITVQYLRDSSSQEIKSSDGPQFQVIETETVIIERKLGDKILDRTESIYVNGELNSQTVDSNTYYEPAPISTTADPNQVQTDVSGFGSNSAAPTENARWCRGCSRHT